MTKKIAGIDGLEAAAVEGEEELFSALRSLSLDQLGTLYLDRPSLPALSRLLPRLGECGLVPDGNLKGIHPVRRRG